MEIKGLENSLQKQESKISQVQKDISCISKKTADCTHKIEQYKKYLRKGQKNQEESESDKDAK